MKISFYFNRLLPSLPDTLFYIILGLFLYPILVNKYFLTGDGPCHIYNSKVFLDFVTGHNFDFYNPYYYLNRQLDPNWFSHASMALLLIFLPDFLAEKVLMLTYVLLFAFGFRALIKAINPENSFVMLLGMPFIFHHVVQMGFWNYTFSVVFFLWAVRWWILYRHDLTIYRMVLFALLLVLTYFSHPVGLVFTVVL